MSKDTILNLSYILKYAGRKGINSILAEGGQQVFSQFLEQDLVDELIIFQAAEIWGRGVNNLKIKKRRHLKLHDCKVIGNDCYINLRKKD